MADVTYSVAIKFNQFWGSSFSTGVTQIDSMQRSADRLGSSLASASGSFMSSFGKGISGAADLVLNTMGGVFEALGGSLATSLTAGMKMGLNFDAMVESAQNGLSATMQMLGQVPQQIANKQANAAVEHLKEMAAILPGEFKDALNAFQNILPAGLNHGFDMKRLESMAGLSVAAAAALNIPQQVAGRELGRMLEGHATAAMPLVAKLGIDTKTFNRQAADKRFEEIEKKFNRLGPAMKDFQNSWVGLVSTTTDYARQFFGQMAEPLRDSIKNSLRQLIDWFNGHKTELFETAEMIGLRVAHGFEVAVSLAKKWIPIALTFADTIERGIENAARKLGPLFERISGPLQKFMEDPAAFEKLQRVALAATGAKLAGGAMNVGRDLLGDVSRLAPMLAQVGVAAGDLAIAGGVGAAAVALFGAEVYGAYDALVDGTSRFHNYAVQASEDIGKNSTKLGQELDKLAEDSRPLGQMLGVAFLTALDTAVYSLTGWVTVLNLIIEKQQSLLGILNPTIDNHEDRTKYDQRGHVLAMDALAPKEGEDKRNRFQPINNVNIGSQHFEFKIVSNEDPDRIATLTAAKIREIARNPTQSPRSPNRQFLR